MKLLTTFVLTVLTISCFAQDTTVVQTLTFEDITKRRDIYPFPPADQEFRKILMYYTLKCDAQTTQDNFDCGEWDYLTYNFVYDHTGELDSNLIEHPSFYVGTSTPETFSYQSNPLYDHYQSWQVGLNVDSILQEELTVVGLGSTLMDLPFALVAEGSARSQFLWNADELQSAGLSAGNINRLFLETGNGSSSLQQITLQLAHYVGENMNGLSDLQFQTVLHQQLSIEPNAEQSFNFTSPFEWDGTSAIVVEMLTTPLDGESGSEVISDIAPSGASWSVSGADGYIEFPAGQFVRIPVDGDDFGDEITVSLWTYGHPESLPANTYCFEALDADGNRALNAHLPWGNGRVYWDAGTGNGYDRIDKAAAASEYSGQWNHWAFTKNGNTGIMNIYLNGELWHSGSDLNRSVGELHQFTLGKGVLSNNGYPGKVDEFRVWNKALNAETIAAWMHREIDPSHPDYSSLKIYYNFNTPQDISDISGNGMDGIAFGSPIFGTWPAGELHKNETELAQRPKITLAQGQYLTSADSVLVTHSVLRPAVSVVEYLADEQVLLGLESEWYWPEGCSYWWSPAGEITDSLCYATESVLINGEVAYYSPAFEVIDRWEIGRFITPYGINLDLGPEGFTWVYDVTDYSHLLRDSVDIQMGNQQELIDVKFLFITGTPPRDVLRISKVWGDMGSHSYAALDNNTSLPPVDVPLLPETQGLLLKTRLTGHGHQSNTGAYPHCCEWKDNTHYIHVGGSEVANWKIWQTNECALNPVFPQGGTWPGAREGWCPGDVVKDNEFDLTSYLGGSSINLDYGITPVPANNQGMGSGNYMVSMHLFEFSSPHFNLDAEINEVLNPSKMQYFSRHNPICSEPRVVIRNNGNQTLTSAVITYGVAGGEHEVFEWTGSLATLESEMVSLPVPNLSFWDGDENSVFEATISLPNGSADEYGANDTFYSPFHKPVTYPHDFIVWFKTNNFPHQNSYTVKDLFGNVVFAKNNLAAQTVYRDTMDLAPGCYTFEFMDTGNDGLSYWANPGQGSGYLRFKLNGGPLMKNLEADFGRKLFEAFVVDELTSVEEVNPNKPRLSIFPNPGNGLFNIELSQLNGSCQMEIYDPVGNRVLSNQIVVNDYHIGTVDLSDKPAGVYFFRIFNSDFQLTRKVINQ